MKKYQHLENNFNIKALVGLLADDTVLIQPKLDGSNCQMYMENGELVITSRNNILSLTFDNAGCYNTLIHEQKYKDFFNDYPNIKLAGEWLVCHKIKYNPDAYRKFYVFDAIYLDSEDEDGKADYMPYDELSLLLDEYNIEHVPHIYIYTHTLKEQLAKDPNLLFTSNLELSNYLIDSDVPMGEGIVVKNYNYKNPFGRSVWCKVINTEVFKQKVNKPKQIKSYDFESKFVDENLNEHLLSKCYYKLAIDGQLDKKLIGDYIKLCQNEFLEDFSQPYILENKITDFNHKAVNNMVAQESIKYIRSLNQI